MRGHGHDLPGHRFAVARCYSGPSGSLSERHGFSLSSHSPGPLLARRYGWSSTLPRVPALRWHGCDVILARLPLRWHALRVSASRRHGFFLSVSPGRTHEVRHGYRLSPRPSPTLLGAVGVVAQGWTCSSLRVAHLERHGLALCTRAVVPDGPRLLPRAVASPVVPRGYAVWVEKTFEFPQHLSRLRARARVAGCQPTHGRGGFQRLEHALLAASAVSRPPGGAW